MARDFAVKAHGNQKYGSEPYIVHLDEVVAVLGEFGIKDENLLVAGYLHDVIEDTDKSMDGIASVFGSEVADFVWNVTGSGNNRKERSESILKKLHGDTAAIPVKLADRIANVRRSKASNPGLFKMYSLEYYDFKQALFDGSQNFINMWECLDSLIR